MAFAQINNANFYYELHGSGHPLILIAGYTCDHTCWQPILEELIKHYQILIFDNRGVGQTKDDHGELTVELMAQDAMALAAYLQLEKSHIVGQSMGGTIAQQIASSYPDKINKVAILNSVAKWRDAMLLGEKLFITMREKNIELDLIIEASIPWIFGEAFLKNKILIEEYKNAMLNNPYPQSIADQKRQFQMLEEFDGRAQLKNIKAPTLVLYGVEDLLALPGESKLLAHEISDVTLIEFDCAHSTMLEAPKELIKTLRHFFN